MTPQALEAATLTPGAVFCSPEEVIAKEAVALEEGMPGQDSDLLRRILLALSKLGAIDIEHAGPSKQHGIAHAQADGG